MDPEFSRAFTRARDRQVAAAKIEDALDLLNEAEHLISGASDYRAMTMRAAIAGARRHLGDLPCSKEA